MKLSLLPVLVLLLLAGCTIRATEDQVARWHGFKLSDRRPAAETRADERCYSHGQATYCYLLGLGTDQSYRIVEVR